jgi:hypothetical protein
MQLSFFCSLVGARTKFRRPPKLCRRSRLSRILQRMIPTNLADNALDSVPLNHED